MKRWLLALLLAVPARAQQDSQETIVECEAWSSWQEGEETIMFLLAPRVVRGDVEIRADSMLLWIPKGRVRSGFRELYAEGNIYFRRGDQQGRAEKLYYDPSTDRAFILNLRGRGRDPKTNVPFQFSAEEAREVEKGTFEAKGMSVSTCTYGVPHYDFYIERGVLRGTQKRAQPDAHDPFPFEGWSFEPFDASLRIWGTKVLPLPAFALSSDESDFPLKSLQVGQTNRFGLYALSRWGVGIRKGWLDALFGNDDKHDDHHRWGEFSVDADWREIRGGATGAHLKYAWDGYWGRTDAYYLHDLGRSDVEFDEKFPDLDDKDRGRVRTFHRHDFLPEWRYEVELSYISDSNLLEEFYPDEFKEGKEQETVLYLRWMRDNMAAFALEKHRLNQFQTQVEYLPRLKYHLFDEPTVWDRMVYTNVTEVVNQRFRFGSAIEGEDERSWRFDSFHELSFPIDLDVLTFAPYVSARGTFYLEDLEGEGQTRFLAGAGARIRTDVHAVHDVSIKPIGLNRLRHIVQLEARIASNFYSSHEETDDLFAFDSVDTLTTFDELSFSVRNRFQTKAGPNLETLEFLDFGLQIEYYLSPGRDTGAFTTNNFAPPFHWITLSPELDGTFETRRWSNLHWDVRFQPLKIFALIGRGEYNPEASREEAREFSAWFAPIPWLSVSVSQTFYRDITDAYSVSAVFRPVEQWYVSASGQYDNQTFEFLQQRVAVGRDFHEFVVEVVFENDEGRDERRFYVNFLPKLLGTPISSHSETQWRP